jgi:hypothetical protein
MTPAPRISHYFLLFRNAHGESFYYLRRGRYYAPKKLFLISKTTKSIRHAKRFPSLPMALVRLESHGNPPGWQVLPIYVHPTKTHRVVR